MADHGPRIDHIIIGAKDIHSAAEHIYKVWRSRVLAVSKYPTCVVVEL